MPRDGLDYRSQIPQRLLAERPVLLVGDRVQQRPDTGILVIKPEVRRCQNRGLISPALEQVGEDANEVAGFLASVATST